MSRIAVLALGAALLAGCDGSDPQLEEQFRTSFVSECVAAAETTGGPNPRFEPICNCAAEKTLEELGPTEGTVPEDMANRFIAECVEETGASGAN